MMGDDGESLKRGGEEGQAGGWEWSEGLPKDRGHSGSEWTGMQGEAG